MNEDISHAVNGRRSAWQLVGRCHREEVETLPETAGIQATSVEFRDSTLDQSHCLATREAIALLVGTGQPELLGVYKFLRRTSAIFPTVHKAYLTAESLQGSNKEYSMLLTTPVLNLKQARIEHRNIDLRAEFLRKIRHRCPVVHFVSAGIRMTIFHQVHVEFSTRCQRTCDVNTTAGPAHRRHGIDQQAAEFLKGQAHFLNPRTSSQSTELTKLAIVFIPNFRQTVSLFAGSAMSETHRT